MYDLEQFRNFHSFYGINVYTKEEVCFVIHESRNDYLKYFRFLLDNKLVGYNNMNYDSHLTDFLIKNFKTLKKLNGASLARELYWISRLQIEHDGYSRLINEYGPPQADLFLIHHYNNKARITSLKWIEFYLRMENVQDLPLNPHDEVSVDMIDEIIKYNRNDVIATLKFYEYTMDKKKFHVRKEIGKKYGIKNITNMSDVKIGEMINRQVYSEHSGRQYDDYKLLRTYRDKIPIKRCMPLNIVKHFRTKQLQTVVKDLWKKEINVKGEGIEYIIEMNDLTVALKQGGLHSEDKPGIFESTDKELIVDIDVSSMYPSIIILYKYFPEHLGVEWLDGYKQTRDKRIPLKKTEPEIAEGLKLSLNGGGFGKTNEEFSWMYDPLTKLAA